MAAYAMNGPKSTKPVLSGSIVSSIEGISDFSGARFRELCKVSHYVPSKAHRDSNIHQAPTHIIFAQNTFFRVFMIRMVHSKKSKGFADLRLLVCVQSILFGELRGALGCCAGFCWSRATLWWLDRRQKPLASQSSMIKTYHSTICW